MNSKRGRVLAYGLVTRYGPQSVASRVCFAPNCNIFSVLSIFKCNLGETNDKFVAS